MATTKNARIAKVQPTAEKSAELVKATDQAIVQPAAPVKLFKSISDFQFEERSVKLADTVVHKGVQKRIKDVDPELGAVKESIERIIGKLENGQATLETLLRRDPIIICGVKDSAGNVTQMARVDGHTRIPALIHHYSVTVTAPVKYFEATERELWIASGSINSENGHALTMAEIKAMIAAYLEDSELVALSDAAMSELFHYQYEGRNIGNLRRAIVIAKVKAMVKEGRDFDGSLKAMIKKYIPDIRKGIDGREQNTAKTGGDKFASIRSHEEFDGLRPEDKAAKEAEKKAAAAAPATTEPAKDQPAATVAPDVKPAETKNFVSKDEPATPEPAATPETTEAPTTEAPAPVETTDDQPAEPVAVDLPAGDLSVYDGVEFSTVDGNVTIRTAAGMITVPVNALAQFVDGFRVAATTESLFDTAA